MSDGTTIKLYAARLHKCNAEAEAADAKDMLGYLERQLIALAASAGDIREDDNIIWPRHEYVARHVPELLGEYADYVVKQLLALEIVNNPEDCDDELEALQDDATRSS